MDSEQWTGDGWWVVGDGRWLRLVFHSSTHTGANGGVETYRTSYEQRCEAGAGTFCPELEPEPKPPEQVMRSHSWSLSRNASPKPGSEPELSENVLAPHLWLRVA